MTSQQQMGGKTFSTVVVVRVPLHWIEFICMCINLVAQMVKNLPAMQETLVQSLGLEDPLEMETATHSLYSFLKNSMDRGAWQAMGSQRNRQD